MAVRGGAIAIDLGRRRLRAVQASRGRGGVRIRRVLVEDVPSDLDFDDAHAVGRWVGQRLREAKFSLGEAVIAIGREHVSLKRLTLPTTDDAELPDMTRLAMQRELPIDADATVIDFVPVERDAVGTTVLAAAAPQRVIDFARQMAKSAGLGVQRVTLRSAGACALVNVLEDTRIANQNFEIGRQHAESVANGLKDNGGAQASEVQPLAAQPGCLAIDITGEGVEFCLVVGGVMRFSRAAEVPHPGDQLAIADAVLTEARRTWMSYRATENTVELTSAVLMGDRRVCAYAAEPVSAMLNVPVVVLESHPQVASGEVELDRVWPLAGLLLELALRGGMIDFAHPRKAPDLGARTRQRRLLIAGAAVVALMGMWTAGKMHLRSLATRAAKLEAAEAAARPQFMRYKRDAAKVEHLEQWSQAGVDWLEHAAHLATLAPPDQLVLDSWMGVLDFNGVSCDRRGRWSFSQDVRIELDGEARDRETADAFRDVLVKSSIYKTNSAGADARGGKRLPFGFTYRLRTQASAPEEQVESDRNSERGEQTSNARSQKSMPLEPNPLGVAAGEPVSGDDAVEVSGLRQFGIHAIDTACEPLAVWTLLAGEAL